MAVPRSSSLRFLSDASFRSFWFSRILTTLAVQMQTVAVGWQVYDITRRPLDLGLVGLVQFLPGLLFALVVGQVADRLDRRKIILVCQAAMALIAAILALGSHGHWMNEKWIFTLVFCFGTARAFQQPSTTALLPSLVKRSLLARAISFFSGSNQAAIIAGPALGGLFYLGGPELVYTVVALVYAGSGMFMFFVATKRRAPSREPISLSSIFGGVSFIWTRPVILGAVSLDLFAVLFGGATALLPIYAREILFIGPFGLGVLRSAPAIGALGMSLYLTRYPIERNAGKFLFGAVAVFGMATIVFALSPWFFVSLLALIATGASDMVSVVIRNTLVQLETPEGMRGRVSAVNSLFIGASNQLGEFESGVTAAWFGAVRAVLLGGIGTLAVVGLWTRLFPELGKRDRL